MRQLSLKNVISFLVCLNPKFREKMRGKVLVNSDVCETPVRSEIVAVIVLSTLGF